MNYITIGRHSHYLIIGLAISVWFPFKINSYFFLINQWCVSKATNYSIEIRSGPPNIHKWHLDSVPPTPLNFQCCWLYAPVTLKFNFNGGQLPNIFFFYRKAIWLFFPVQFINHNIAPNFYRSLSCRKSFLSISFFHFILLCDTTMHTRGSRPCTSVLPVPHLEMSLKASGLGTGIHKNHKHIQYKWKKNMGRVYTSNSQISTTWSDNIYKKCHHVDRLYHAEVSHFIAQILWHFGAPGSQHVHPACAASAWMSLTTLLDSVPSDRRTFYIIQLCK